MPITCEQISDSIWDAIVNIDVKILIEDCLNNTIGIPSNSDYNRLSTHFLNQLQDTQKLYNQYTQHYHQPITPGDRLQLSWDTLQKFVTMLKDSRTLCITLFHLEKSPSPLSHAAFRPFSYFSSMFSADNESQLLFLTRLETAVADLETLVSTTAHHLKDHKQTLEKLIASGRLAAPSLPSSDHSKTELNLELIFPDSETPSSRSSDIEEGWLVLERESNETVVPTTAPIATPPLTASVLSTNRLLDASVITRQLDKEECSMIIQIAESSDPENEDDSPASKKTSQKAELKQHHRSPSLNHWSPSQIFLPPPSSTAHKQDQSKITSL